MALHIILVFWLRSYAELNWKLFGWSEFYFMARLVLVLQKRRGFLFVSYTFLSGAYLFLQTRIGS